MNERGVYLAVASGGAVFAYAGLRGKSITGVIQQIITGKSPVTAAQTTGIMVPAPAAGTPSGSVGGAAGGAAGDAARYLGVMYKWGGANPSGFDCSGLVNYVFGHDLGLNLPGGISNFQGTFHGPVTGQWFTTNLCTTVPNGQMQPGDLAVWLTHMGIVSGPNQMINAYTTGKPVAVTAVNGFIQGEPLRIRRYTGMPQVVGSPGLPAGFGG